MKAVFNLGSEFDMVTGDELKATAKDLQDSIIKRLPKSRTLPIRQTAVGAAVTPAAGPTVITLVPQGPAAGRIWCLTHVVITGNDDRTTVAGATFAVYRGEPPAGFGQAPNLSGLLSPATGSTIPLERSYSENAVWIRGGETVFAMVYGAAAGTSLQMMIDVMDYPDSVMESGLL